MDIKKEREAFEELWLQGNGHFKYFKFSAENGKYISTGVRDNLTNQDLLFASITINTAYLFFLGGTKKAQAVPEGFVLVPNENLSTFYQDDSEPENFCTLESDLDILGDGLDCGDVMVVNKYNQAEISKEKLYGVWCEIETSYGTAKKFKVFKTEEQAKKSMIEAQEQSHD
ncbi:hypothetical protein [Acinetobacter sp. ANC 4648]|uniref:hypothetical protein n=1 Tax=Acinetobacter sp. ANC 4648 TaxID=1977875 RepID=UPI000A3321A3|nr:hypothetical protein [Acinetobacter sp. ANC 4648]OTG81531.1 hypothetical protein B9T27_09615 [Acinetobacter sp. ANC 4648]